MNKKYEQYKNLMRKIADINYSVALLHWDQEINMPIKGAAIRAQQIGSLSGISHDIFISNELGNLLQELNGNSSLSEKESRNIAQSYKDYIRSKKYTTDFVVTLNQTIAESYQTWNKAKQEDNYDIFSPFLDKLIKLKKEETGLLGYKDHPYDALLDLFEPGTQTKDIDLLFNDYKNHFIESVQKIAVHPQNDNSFLQKHYEKNNQWNFGIYLLKQMNYDFTAGRQDISSHPFTVHFNSKDVRVTTRINENNLSSMTFCCIHEGGHALYEQSFNVEDYGLPSGDAISLGIHESQSRLWENHVGRSLSYWKANYKKLQEIFPENLSKVTLNQFYKGINVVQPSFIRVEADELTYHFHVLIRFELEKELLTGNLSVKDLPEAWNQKYKQYLNIDVPSNKLGVLQDIHWAYGNFGYFPTYSLGSFYAAQFFNKATQDIDELQLSIEKGNLMPLLQWLRKNIHAHGKLYSAEEICKRVTGEKLNLKYFIDYIENKFTEIYEQLSVNSYQ